MGGGFAHRSVDIRWTFEKDGGCDEGNRWLFQVGFGDISVSRRYPNPIPLDEANASARRIAPELIRIAEEWLK